MKNHEARVSAFALLTNNEKELLLEISQLIASIKERKELFRFILEKVNPLIPVDDIGLVILNKEATKWKDWAVIDNYLETKGNTLLYQSALDGYHDIDSLHAKALKSTGIITREEIAKHHQDLAFYDVLVHASPNEEYLYTPLVYQNKTLGVLWFDAYKTGTYRTSQFALFEAIGSIVATAVANVLANEEILEREREKNLLLEITQALSRTNHRLDLLQVIYHHVSHLFSYDGSGLFMIDEAANYHQLLIHSNITGDRTHPVGTLEKIPYRGSACEWMAQSFGIHLLSDIKQQIPEHPHYSDLEKLGIQQMMHGPLQSNGKIIGMFCLNSKQADGFTQKDLILFHHLAEQLSVATANILANEEILEREREKSMLLSISKFISTIRDKESLFRILTNELKPIFKFDDALIIINEKNDTRYRVILAEISNPSIEKDFFTKLYNTSFPYEIGNYREVLDYTSPKVVLVSDLKEQLEQQYPAMDEDLVLQNTMMFAILEQSGLQVKMQTRLHYSGNKVGMIVFLATDPEAFTAPMFSLFQSVADQIAVAVSNILANEEIEKQLKEITYLKKQLEAENIYMQEEVKKQFNYSEIIGTSEALQAALNKVDAVAATDATVLLLGETGTGKELFARAIHNASPRKSKPLIKINCAALPPQLIESELFGHERGSFTGAIDRRIGKFELANGSTLLLDEVGEMPMELQAKLLRAIQEKEIERLGSNKTIKSDVRIIAATNRDLPTEIKAGKFRMDLYYRLNVFPIYLPALRERKEDIPLLADHFIKTISKKTGKPITGISKNVLEAIVRYPWPGNIRELEHQIERCVILAQTKTLKNIYLPEIEPNTPEKNAEEYTLKTFGENERDYILFVLKKCHGRVKGKGGAAELLGVPSTTLNSKMKKLGIRREHVGKA